MQYIINDDLPLCTDEERWRRKDTYRVEKKGRKTAVRVLDTREEADEYIGGHKDSKLLKVVEAKGECVRCANYCDVAKFCNQYNEESK